MMMANAMARAAASVFFMDSPPGKQREVQ
jgi:hypothetical protein